MTMSTEEKRLVLLAQDVVKEKFKQLNRAISTNRHEEYRKFKEISQDCGYVGARRNSPNRCYAVKTVGLQTCQMGICTFVESVKEEKE